MQPIQPESSVGLIYMTIYTLENIFKGWVGWVELLKHLSITEVEWRSLHRENWDYPT